MTGSMQWTWELKSIQSKVYKPKELGNMIHSKKQDESGKTYTVMIAELELIGKDLRTVVTGKFRAGQMAQLVKELAL